MRHPEGRFGRRHKLPIYPYNGAFWPAKQDRILYRNGEGKANGISHLFTGGYTQRDGMQNGLVAEGWR